ncbi:MAG TPA: hypothetical protein PLG90_05705 [Ignavibacteria bacterium]|nr:hypothetical protein [Ignavibacteria bacterium]
MIIKIILLFINLLIYTNLIYSKDSVIIKNIVSPFYCNPCSYFNVKSDSVNLEGYIIFEIDKDIQYFKYDSLDSRIIDIYSILKSNIFFIEDIKNWDSDSLKCYINNIQIDLFGYLNTTNLSGWDTCGKFKFDTLNFLSDYKRLEKIYEIYQKQDSVFLNRSLNLSILKNVEFYNNKGEESNIGYYIFKAKFPSTILNYSCAYELNKNGETINIFMDSKKFLFPLGKSEYFTKISPNEAEKYNFVPSDWIPKQVMNLKE